MHQPQYKEGDWILAKPEDLALLGQRRENKLLNAGETSFFRPFASTTTSSYISRTLVITQSHEHRLLNDAAVFLLNIPFTAAHAKEDLEHAIARVHFDLHYGPEPDCAQPNNIEAIADAVASMGLICRRTYRLRRVAFPGLNESIMVNFDRRHCMSTVVSIHSTLVGFQYRPVMQSSSSSTNKSLFRLFRKRVETPNRSKLTLASVFGLGHDSSAGEQPLSEQQMSETLQDDARGVFAQLAFVLVACHCSLREHFKQFVAIRPPGERDALTNAPLADLQFEDPAVAFANRLSMLVSDEASSILPTIETAGPRPAYVSPADELVLTQLQQAFKSKISSALQPDMAAIAIIESLQPIVEQVTPLWGRLLQCFALDEFVSKRLFVQGELQARGQLRARVFVQTFSREDCEKYIDLSYKDMATLSNLIETSEFVREVTRSNYELLNPLGIVKRPPIIFEDQFLQGIHPVAESQPIAVRFERHMSKVSEESEEIPDEAELEEDELSSTNESVERAFVMRHGHSSSSVSTIPVTPDSSSLSSGSPGTSSSRLAPVELTLPDRPVSPLAPERSPRRMDRKNSTRKSLQRFKSQFSIQVTPTDATATLFFPASPAVPTVQIDAPPTFVQPADEAAALANTETPTVLRSDAVGGVVHEEADAQPTSQQPQSQTPRIEVSEDASPTERRLTRSASEQVSLYSLASHPSSPTDAMSGSGNESASSNEGLTGTSSMRKRDKLRAMASKMFSSNRSRSTDSDAKDEPGDLPPKASSSSSTLSVRANGGGARRNSMGNVPTGALSVANTAASSPHKSASRSLSASSNSLVSLAQSRKKAARTRSGSISHSLTNSRTQSGRNSRNGSQTNLVSMLDEHAREQDETLARDRQTQRTTAACQALKTQLPIQGFFHSELQLSDSVSHPFIVPPVTNQRHLVVFVHGLEGSDVDLFAFRNALLLTIPTFDCFLSVSNKNDTYSSFEVMTDNLVKELEQYLAHVKVQPAFISFVGHSLGNIVIRNALTRPELLCRRDKLHTYVSLSAPHLGTVLGDSSAVQTGMRAMRAFHRNQGSSLAELALADSSNPRQSLLYRLSMQAGLAMFSNVLLVASMQDRYVPYHSARIEMNPKALKDRKLGPVYMEMLGHLLEPLKQRRDVSFVRFNIMNEFPSKNMDSMLGRAAHISILDSEVVLRHLLAVIVPYLQSEPARRTGVPS
ncbi:hypothetical protein, variant 1 [Capsaspora owczarzaki ATCC 30864]|nr:hypothetical protein, variant 1 [Capsaspora owczarzaki ATCC 30864]